MAGSGTGTPATGAGNYCALADIKARLEIGTEYDDWLAGIITGASRFIDRWCLRSFEAAAEATKYFDGNGKEYLIVPDLVTISASGLIVEDDTWVATDYILYPLNETPKMKIFVDPDGAYSAFTAGRKNVEITANWGYAANAPAEDNDLADLWDVCVQLAIRSFKAAEQAYQDAGAIPELGQLFYKKALTPYMVEVLNRYKRRFHVLN